MCEEHETNITTVWKKLNPCLIPQNKAWMQQHQTTNIWHEWSSALLFLSATQQHLNRCAGKSKNCKHTFLTLCEVNKQITFFIWWSSRWKTTWSSFWWLFRVVKFFHDCCAMLVVSQVDGCITLTFDMRFLLWEVPQSNLESFWQATKGNAQLLWVTTFFKHWWNRLRLTNQRRIF